MPTPQEPPPDRWVERLRRFPASLGEPGFVAAACLVGVLTGGAAIAFAELIALVQWVAIGGRDLALYLVPWIPWWRVLLAPALGGLLVGLAQRFFGRESEGHGVPDVMEAVALRGGRVARRVVVTKAVASALTIGSGGSAGREGPIVQIGASVGSAVGQLLRLPADRLRTLTAAGAAGGIAAAFNAPIAGAFFALEVIARNFATTTFGPVVLCAVFSTVVSRLWFGATPAFRVPPFELGAWWETTLAAPLGVFCGLVAVGFVVAMARIEHLFRRLPLPRPLKPALGGLLVGAMILATPFGLGAHLYGVGYETMDQTLSKALAWRSLAILLVMKPIATSTTLSSGGSGGVFQPSLYIGGLAGGVFGALVPHVVPGATMGPGAWALVGMAAVLAGSSHAPVTAILLAFELTQDYAVILPVMVASALATLVARTLYRDSIYTRTLRERGIDLDRREDVVLRGVSAGEVMQRNPPAVRMDAPLDVVLARFLDTDLGAVFVIDAESRLLGQVSLHDVKASLGEEATLGGIVLAGDVSERAPVVRPETTVAEALARLTREGREVLGVVDAEGRLVGALSARGVMDVLAREALREEWVGVVSARRRRGGNAAGLRLSRGVEVRPFPVPDSLLGATLRTLNLRSRFGLSAIALRREGADQGVDPDRPLAKGDTLVLMGEPRSFARFADSLRQA